MGQLVCYRYNEETGELRQGWHSLPGDVTRFFTCHQLNRVLTVTPGGCQGGLRGPFGCRQLRTVFLTLRNNVK
jgi:hypothetical protein